jgi:hypothetical protein
MAEIITQQLLLAGHAYRPIPGETRYAIAAGVVAVLNEAYEANVEAFEDAELEAAAEQSAHLDVIRDEKSTTAERIDATRAIRRVQAAALERKLREAVSLQGMTWDKIGKGFNRTVAERATMDFLFAAMGLPEEPPTSSAESNPDAPAPSTPLPAPPEIPTTT